MNSEWALTTHMANVHMEILQDGRLLKHQCKICLKSYLYESGLKLHYSSHHRELGIDYSVICDVCGKSLSCKSKLKQHLRTYTGDKPFPCPICSRKFITKDLIISHMRVHTGEKPYVCMYCGKEFAQDAPYWYHLKTHTG
uniref:Gastrula zinc finger protein XlCGF8.2DB-like n=1 Tax=Diabrotica virgifera virgifera TaxID=50390 RepID=A0A6P7EZN2_DIAVI